LHLGTQYVMGLIPLGEQEHIELMPRAVTGILGFPAEGFELYSTLIIFQDSSGDRFTSEIVSFSMTQTSATLLMAVWILSSLLGF